MTHDKLFLARTQTEKYFVVTAIISSVIFSIFDNITTWSCVIKHWTIWKSEPCVSTWVHQFSLVILPLKLHFHLTVPHRQQRNTYFILFLHYQSIITLKIPIISQQTTFLEIKYFLASRAHSQPYEIFAPAHYKTMIIQGVTRVSANTSRGESTSYLKYRSKCSIHMHFEALCSCGMKFKCDGDSLGTEAGQGGCFMS